MSEKEIYIKEDEEKLSYDILEESISNWMIAGGIRVPVISNELSTKDKVNTVLLRMGFNRKNYKVPFGLYAFGKPDENSDVFITGNYKYSFDSVRVGLNGENCWLLVLDTKGINVWCAAGKGTFSSRELIYQLEKWNIKNIVNHKTIILPQLGATQMEPHLVKKYSGFNIVYGPIRSEDLIEFIKSGKVASEKMRTITFDIKERLVLTPVEIIHSVKYLIIMAIFFYLINLISGEPNINSTFKYEIMNIIYAILGGTVLFPLLLPILPFKSFSLKGGVLGLVMSLLLYGGLIIDSSMVGKVYFLGMFLGTTLIVSILGLIFTGSTTYTSFSGVDYETKKSLPIFIVLGILSVLLILVSKFI